MGCCFSSNEPKIKIIDVTPEGSSFDYSRPNGTITYLIDRTYNIPLIELDFGGWFERSICLWPKNNSARSNFLLLERTPSPSPNISYFPSESGVFDTVF